MYNAKVHIGPEITQVHLQAAKALIVLSYISVMVIAAVRIIFWDDPLDLWIKYSTIAPICLSAFWFIVFVIGGIRLLHRTINRWSMMTADERDFHTSGCKAALLGITYCSFLLVLLFDIRFDFERHLMQLLATSKLGSMHLVSIFIYKLQMPFILLSLMAAGSYFTLGLVLYLLPMEHIFMGVDLLAAGALNVFCLLEVLEGQWIFSASLLVISGSYWTAAFSSNKILSTTLFVCGLLPGGYASWVMLVKYISRTLGFLFGEPSLAVDSTEEQDPILIDRNYEESSYVVYPCQYYSTFLLIL